MQWPSVGLHTGGADSVFWKHVSGKGLHQATRLHELCSGETPSTHDGLQ